jgi:RNA polymerase sigma factor (TIGR02999 family)
MATTEPNEGSPPGGGSDSDRFFSEVYAELRSIARRRMRGERRARTFQSTELVHEAYLRLRKDRGREWETPGHFFAAAAEAMRRILIDRARARRRLKRGADSAGMPARRLTLDLREVAELADEQDPESILAFDRALERLEAQDERLMSTVKLRFYAGLSVEETAEALQVSPRTVKRDWAFARAWLFEQLRADPSQLTADADRSPGRAEPPRGNSEPGGSPDRE